LPARQQLHKEPIRKLWSYWCKCHNTHEQIKPTCNQIRNKNHTNETRQWPQPPKHANSWWRASQPPDPHWKLLLFSVSRWDVVWRCIHWLFQFHAGGVHATIFFLFIKELSWQKHSTLTKRLQRAQQEAVCPLRSTSDTSTLNDCAK